MTFHIPNRSQVRTFVRSYASFSDAPASCCTSAAVFYGPLSFLVAPIVPAQAFGAILIDKAR